MLEYVVSAKADSDHQMFTESRSVPRSLSGSVPRSFRGSAGIGAPVAAEPSLAMPLLLFGAAVGALLLAHQGGRMGVIFPILSVSFAIWAARARPVLYIAFTFLLYLATPVVRRLADYQSSYHDPSPVLAAPLLVSLACIIAIPGVVRGMGRTQLRSLLPFAMALLGVLYGFGIGFFKSTPAELVRPGLEWLAPIIFGAYCALHASRYPLLALLEKISLVGILILDLYGIIQFVSPLPWDIFWLQNFNLAHFQPSFGQPEPMQIRLFSMLNSPQTYAAMLTFSLPLLMTLRSNLLSAVAVPLTLLCLGLTQSRSQLFAVALSIPLLLFFSRSRAMLRLASIAGVLLLTLSVGAVSGDMMNKLKDRFDTFNNLKGDESMVSRRLGMQFALQMIVDEPFGQGIGFPDGRAFERSDLAARYAVDTHDLGVVEAGISFGLLGATLYVGAFAYALYRMVRRMLWGARVGAGLPIAVLSCLATMATVNLFQGLPGIWLWTTLGCILAGGEQQSSIGWYCRQPLDESQPTLLPAKEYAL